MGTKSILVLALLLGACGSDDSSDRSSGGAGTGASSAAGVVWQCQCDQECDGTTYVLGEGAEVICFSQAQAQAAVDVATAACAADGEATCNAYECTCACDPQMIECEP